jgi:hypothetical protein
MTSLSHVNLALQRYQRNGIAYNSRMVKGFMDKVRADFKPRPASLDNELDYNEYEIQKEGYIFEGALSKFMHMEALLGFIFQLGPSPTAAEKAGQIYYKAPESLFEALPHLIAAQLEGAELVAHRTVLLEDLQYHVRPTRMG